MFLPFILTIVAYLFTLRPAGYISWMILVLESLGLILAFLLPFYFHENTLTEKLFSGILLGIGSGITIFLFFKFPHYRIYQFVFFLIICRLVFNFSILPRRAMHRTPYGNHARLLSEKQVTNYITEEKNEQVYNLLINRNISMTTYDHPAYQLSFYYTRLTQKPLSISTFEQAGNVYLQSDLAFDSDPQQVILDTLEVEATKADYLLYRFSPRQQ